MKIIPANKIKATVADLCVKANLQLRSDVLTALKSAYRSEKDKRAKRLLKAIIDNAAFARKEKLAICQDTGLAVVFLEIGTRVFVKGDIIKAVNAGVVSGYKKACLRDSVIKDPLSRGKPGYQPALVHCQPTAGSKLKITVLPKGFGCENKTQLKMFNPTAGTPEIKKFIVDALRSAGADACPPYIVGVGIGGTADYAVFLAKKALLRDVAKPQSRKVTGQIVKLERELLREINKLNIGPMGLGGKATALAVNIETFATHIAGLPVAINISCHALRSASAQL